MLKIGLTGGIGSGKSRVAELLAGWGAEVIDADAIAHALTAPGGAAMEAVVAAFGEQARTPEGALDRAYMRDLVFRQPGARHRLEAILHPLIQQQSADRAAAAMARPGDTRPPYIVFVVPLLVESGHWRARVDRVCVVDCDPETQVARVAVRSGLSRETVERVMAAQIDRGSRLAAADDIINNDGSVSPDGLSRQARALHDAWRAGTRSTPQK